MLFTEKTVATGNHKRDHHPVAALNIFHPAASFHHFPHKFMAEDIAMFHLRNFASIEMQVGAANCGSGNAQDDIVRLFNGRVGNIFNANGVRAMVRQSSHADLQRGKGGKCQEK